MAAYHLLTTWCVDAPLERVWNAIYAVEEWPRWWRGVEVVEKLEQGTNTASAASTATAGGAGFPTPSGSTS